MSARCDHAAGQVMAVGTRPSNKVHWLVVDSEQEVGVTCHDVLYSLIP